MVKIEKGSFDPMNRGLGRPHTTSEVILRVVYGVINILFQYYLLYGGGAGSFYDYIGYDNDAKIAFSSTQKMIMMILFVENQLHASFFISRRTFRAGRPFSCFCSGAVCYILFLV